MNDMTQLNDKSGSREIAQHTITPEQSARYVQNFEDMHDRGVSWVIPVMLGSVLAVAFVGGIVIGMVWL
jgi:hypothetical protein